MDRAGDRGVQVKCPHCGKRYANNKTVIVEHNGEPMSLRELAQTVGLAPSTLVHRYARGKRGAELIEPADERFARRGNSGESLVETH